MFEKNRLRISELENRIDAIQKSIQTNQAAAKALQLQGESSAGKIPNYFGGLLTLSEQKFADSLAAHPLPSAAGWDASVWDAWEAAHSRHEFLIRVGDLFEERSNKALRIPGYLPFLGKNRTIIISGREVEKATSLMQSLIVRTALMLPHQAKYTLLDPSGHGIAFPMRKFLPHVQDHSGDVRRDLDQVIAQIQRIIETYLDASTTSFEAVPHEIRINERFQFVFAANFPEGFDRRAIEALQSIANTGPVAGTYLFIHHNPSYEMPRDMSLAGFKNAYTINLDSAGSSGPLQFSFSPDRLPEPELQNLVFRKLSEAKTPERVIPWNNIASLPEDKWWKGQTGRILESPIGARGGGESLRLWFGVNHENQPCAHGMLGAMTGAGKSYLYHSFIAGLTIRYSPEELRLYLIDGKDGVEFQPYRKLPHAEVVSLRSSPELSRSVLAELIAEKERRNALFVRCDVNDLTTYREKGEREGRLPRILLLVDEYQELFEGDKDGVASNYLLQLSQQGRSAGIHMLLGSQRFGAAGMMNQTGIFGNIHLLLAMKMNIADTHALSQFGRRGKALIATCDLPGKIVVNDQGGDDAANITGKVAFLPLDDLDELLTRLNEKANELPDSSLPQRVIFNGKAQPALIDNPYLARLLRHNEWMSPEQLAEFARQSVETGGLGIVDWFQEEGPRSVWLGQQFNVRGQAMMMFRRRVAENALIVGSANAARYGMLVSILCSLALNLDPRATQFAIFDRSVGGARWHGVLQKTAEALGSVGFSVTFEREANKAEAFLQTLVQELDRRKNLPEMTLSEEPSIFVVMTELDAIETLRRRADDYAGAASTPAGECLRRLYVEGPPLGIHSVLSFSGARPMVNVIDDRRGLVNFRHRVALQMSEDDSHTLTRGRKASQLQSEGPVPVCALYLDVESDLSVRFKPYSTDSSLVAQNADLMDQVRSIAETLAQRESQK